MRHIERFPAPQVLVDNEKRWLGEHLKKVEEAIRQDPTVVPRPSSKQYGHREIRETLRAMSHGKCFYCEQRLAEKDEQIDHAIEVTLRPDLAFAWDNLYLSCSGCNEGKPREDAIPVASCVDPCSSRDDPRAHLEYDDEELRGIPGTKGTKTIQKYRLNREEIALKRAKVLLQFNRIFRAISGEMNARMRQRMTDEQRNMLLRFAEPDRPFSAMFARLLEGIPLLSR